MCWNCHQGFPDNVILQQFQKSLINPKFEQWNTTSVNHTVIAGTGHNGLEVRNIALEILAKLAAHSSSHLSKDANKWYDLLVRFDFESIVDAKERFHAFNDQFKREIKEIQEESDASKDQYKEIQEETDETKSWHWRYFFYAMIVAMVPVVVHFFTK